MTKVRGRKKMDTRVNKRMLSPCITVMRAWLTASRLSRTEVPLKSWSRRGLILFCVRSLSSRTCSSCSHWPGSLRPSEANRFKGPFKSSTRDYDSRGAPVLFIGNMFDNVTPLRNAHAMSKDHEGSVVLTQNSSGHCSAFSSPSECTRKVIRRYFDTGELPAKGTICKADRVPWDGLGKKAKTSIETSS